MTGDVQRRVAEVLAGHRSFTLGMRVEWVRCRCGAVPDASEAQGRPWHERHQAAVLAAEGLLARDDAGFTPQGSATLVARAPVAGGNWPVSAQTVDLGHPDQDEATGAAE